MTPGRRKTILAFAVVALTASAWYQFGPRTPAPWTEADLIVLRSLSLDSLPALPPDPTNAVADRPRAASFGHQLFFDTRLSANGAVSCATCHQPERRFSDGLPKGRGVGLSGRNTRSIVGTAYSPWLYWDGRKDSQWAQALSPLEDPAEHGGNRMQYVRFISTDPEYRAQYEELFGPLPDFSKTSRFPDAAAPLEEPTINAAWLAMTDEDRRSVNRTYANIGKAIAAYERLIMPGPSRFDAYVKELLSGDEKASQPILTDEEILGLQLFIDEARCTECHNGPLFTNNEFHNNGILSFPGELPDRGRIDGLKKVLVDPFNCLGEFSDDPDKRCAELTYVRSGIELIGATRTPSLRNLGGTAPYSHKGQNETLADLLDLYNRAPLAMIGHSEAEVELGLNRRDLKQLEEFLNTLDAPLATSEEWLRAP
jgi:cytochrome c peroxidase